MRKTPFGESMVDMFLFSRSACSKSSICQITNSMIIIDYG